MAELTSWDELIAGTGCPLCAPRPQFTDFHYFVRKLRVSSLYLSREQTYRGASVVVYDLGHIVRIDQLSIPKWVNLATDIWLAESAVYRALKPDHVNVESLGNQVPHLHFHVIPRYKNDGRWRGPIWTNRKEMPDRRLNDAEYAELARLLNSEIERAV
jgi:diadenosine tetraphosphate (Ap4A) HIT family hydrolase